MKHASSDYFGNHMRRMRFPWSLYHAPIEKDLLSLMGELGKTKLKLDVLVIGCGLMLELPRLPASLRMVCTDIDERAIQHVRGITDPRILRAEVVAPDRIDFQGRGQYDLIYAKEVIEHIPQPVAYLNHLKELLKPDGTLWLSTPNYGEPWLPLIETTFLEYVANRSKFSRKKLHPSKFSVSTLHHTLEEAGFAPFRCRTVSYRLAITCAAKPRNL